jgi:protein phosphatase
MRALQSGTEAEPDLSTLPAKAGDRFMLCSDGLSDVVTEATLRETLLRYPDRAQAVEQLIDLAIRGGGPDNITCIVADVVDEVTEPTAPAAVMAGAASNGDGRPQRRTSSPAATRRTAKHSAGSDVTYVGIPERDLDPGEAEEDGGPEEASARRRRWPIVTTILVILVIVIAGGGFAAWRYTQSQYYVGTDGHQVIIYRGINQKVAFFDLSSVYQETGILLSLVPTNDKAQVEATTPASSLADAQKTVSSIRQAVACQRYTSASASWAAHKPAAPGKTASAKVKATYATAVHTWQARKPAPPAGGCTLQQGTAG